MGWWPSWEKTKEWSSWSYNVVKTIATKEWIKGAVKDTVNFGLTAWEYTGMMLTAMPRASLAAIFNRKIRRLMGNMLRIAGENGIPILIAGYLNDTIQRYQDSYQEEADDAWLSVDTFILCSLSTLNWAIWGYKQHQRMQAGIRTGIALLDASGTFKDKFSEVALSENKEPNTLVFLQTSFRGTVIYYGVEGVSYVISYFPWVGGYIASAVSIYNKGRLVNSVILPLYMPNKTIYPNEHTELALANGITHGILSYGLKSLIEYYTTLPAHYYEAFLDQLLLAGQMNLTAHALLLPDPAKSSSNLPDPFSLATSATDLGLDIIVTGSRIVIPERLKNMKGPSIIHWEDVPRYALQAQETFMKIPSMQSHILPSIKWLILPKILSSKKAFINDPCVHWDSFRYMLIQAIKDIRKAYDNYGNKAVITLAVNVPSAIPEMTVYLFFGTPRMLTHLLLKIIENDKVLTQCEVWRRELEGMHAGESPGIVVNQKAHAFRGQEPKQLINDSKPKGQESEGAASKEEYVEIAELKTRREEGPSTSSSELTGVTEENKKFKKPKTSLSSHSEEYVVIEQRRPATGKVTRRNTEGGLLKRRDGFFKEATSNDPDEISPVIPLRNRKKEGAGTNGQRFYAINSRKQASNSDYVEGATPKSL